MKLNIRLISLLLSLIMVIGMFAACDLGSDETTVDPSQDTEAPSSSEETTGSNDISTPGSFDIIVNNEAQVRIIRPEGLTSSDPAVEAAVSLRNKIESATGVRVDMYDDFKKPTEEYDENSLEILVGYTRYPQTAEALSDLKYSDYTIKAVGNKIVVFGFTDGAISFAAKALADIIEDHMTGEKGSNVTVSIPASELNKTDEHSGSSNLSALPYYDGTSYSGYYESDLSCQEIILSDATVENYNAYITKLQNNGFTKYTDNDINGNIFTTLYNKDYTLQVGFYKPFNECRIIMEPFSEKTLIGLESDNKYTAVTTSQVTMLGCEYESGGSNTGNGLSLLFRLADGSFVIVDGGHTTKSANWANNLINAITEQAKGYATSTKDIRIAAWFVSHPHGDHSGMMNKQHSLFKKFTVERVIACFMTDAERERSMASSTYGKNWSSGEGGGDDNVRTAAANMGADFIVAHVGQVFYFGDTSFEILYTIESYGPEITNALNTSTILVRAVTKDASGKESSTMIMGDVTGPAMNICNKMYGSYMRSNVVQVAHHGYTTWGNDTAMATAYKYMSPEIVLWPQGLKAFPNYKEKSYNKVLWDGTNKNYQQLYVAGWDNTQHIVPLPYTGDVSTIVSKVTVQP